MPESLALRLRRHLAGHARQVMTALLALMISAISLFALARWAGGFVPGLVAGAPLATLWRDAGIGVVLLALATGSAAVRDVTLVSLATDFSSALRLEMLRALVRQPASAVRAQPAGESLMRIAGDITLLHQSLVRVLALWGPSVVTSVLLLGAIVVTTPVLALATAVLIAPMLIAIGSVSARLTGSVRLAQEHLASLGGAIGEALAGVREAKVFRREAALERRFAELSNRAVQHMLREERLAVTHPAAVSFVAVTALLALILLAGSLTQFLVLLGLLVGPLQEAFRSYGSTVRLQTLYQRCAELLSTPPEREAADAIAIEDAPGALSFRGVTVRHPGTGFILGPVELEVVPGETIVLVGPSGSGKSTLLELVPRLADPDDGAILLDGVELSRLSLDSLRGRCALVPQEPYFFAGTIEENLTFAAPQVDRRALHLACRAAHVEEFVQRLPQGYATPLARGASNLSVGQRQRLAMARAMLVSPRILLLDEPTAALDDESEQLLVDALRAFSDGRTTIIASHAPRVLPLAHRIVRLVHGRVVGIEAGMRATPPHVRAPRPVTDA
jgi:ABC-type multidrug transport system fused ATPase/permease subunit